LVTPMGDAFAGRVAASLLNSLGLQELVATSSLEYEALAVGLARDPVRLAAIRQKLSENRTRSILFNAERQARNLEAVFLKMHQRRLAMLPPAHIELEAD